MTHQEKPGIARDEVNPFERGYQDERKGLGFLDNPFDTHSVEGRRWIDGHVKSMQDRRRTLALVAASLNGGTP
jgi:hypothetical protein